MRTYKILFINQTGKSWDLSDNTRYFSEHLPEKQRLNCEVTEVVGNYKLRHKLTRKSNNKIRLTLTGVREAIAKDYSGYDTYVFAYNEKDTPFYNTVKNNKDWYIASVTPFERLHNKAYCEIAVEDNWNNQSFVRTFNHELHHCLERLFYSVGIFINDVMDKTLVNGTWKSYWRNRDMFGKDTNRTRTMEVFAPYWYKLPLVSDKTLEKAIQALTRASVGYKYFKSSEFTHFDKMKEVMLNALDATRGDSGFPFNITSDWRTTGSHSSGYEVDIDIDGGEFYKLMHTFYKKGKGREMWKLVNTLRPFLKEIFKNDKQFIATCNAIDNGFTRIGLYDGHMHFGMDPSSPQKVIWTGISE